MPGLHPSCRLEPAVPRPRLYAGADQPARLSLEIGAIKDHGKLLPVVSQEVLQMPFCALTPAQIDEGVRRLAEAMAEVRAS